MEGVPWILGGDTLISIQGKPVRSAQEFQKIVKLLNVGESVDIEYVREGEIYRITLPLGQRPVASMKPSGYSGSQMQDTLTPATPWMGQSNKVVY